MEESTANIKATVTQTALQKAWPRAEQKQMLTLVNPMQTAGYFIVQFITPAYTLQDKYTS